MFGLGQHEEGHYWLRGTHQDLYQHNLKIALPVVVSSRSYAIFVDCASAMEFWGDESGFHFACRSVDRLEFYLLVGDSFDGVVKQIHELTGAPPMLSGTLLGYVQSKGRYVDQTEVLDMVTEFCARSICIRRWPTREAQAGFFAAAAPRLFRRPRVLRRLGSIHARPGPVCAPITRPSQRRSMTRTVWLLRGHRWYEYGRQITHLGGTWVRTR